MDRIGMGKCQASATCLRAELQSDIAPEFHTSLYMNVMVQKLPNLETPARNDSGFVVDYHSVILQRCENGVRVDDVFSFIRYIDRYSIPFKSSIGPNSRPKVRIHDKRDNHPLQAKTSLPRGFLLFCPRHFPTR